VLADYLVHDEAAEQIAALFRPRYRLLLPALPHSASCFSRLALLLSELNRRVDEAIRVREAPER